MINDLGLKLFLLNAGPAAQDAHAVAGDVSLWQHIVDANVFNVAVILIVFGVLAKKFNLLGSFDSQQRKIAGEIEQVVAQKKKAQQELETIQKRTAGLNKEVETILADARQLAEGLSVQIIENAREEASKIVETSKKRIELEQKTAVQDLERRMIQGSMSDAREMLAREMNKTEQKRSVEDFISALSSQKFR